MEEKRITKHEEGRWKMEGRGGKKEKGFYL